METNNIQTELASICTSFGYSTIDPSHNKTPASDKHIKEYSYEISTQSNKLTLGTNSAKISIFRLK